MDKERFRERNMLEKTVERIDRDVDAAVVEGYSDRKVLRELGFESMIFESAERSVEDLAEDLERAAGTIAVLTDFDSHGEEQARKIGHALQGRVDVIDSARDELRGQMKSEGRMAVEDARPLLHSRQQKFVDALLDRLFMG